MCARPPVALLKEFSKKLLKDTTGVNVGAEFSSVVELLTVVVCLPVSKCRLFDPGNSEPFARQ